MYKVFAILALLALVVGCAPEEDRMPGLSPLAVEFGGVLTQDAADFGYVPNLLGDTDNTISISAWVKPNATTPLGLVAGFSSSLLDDHAGLRFMVNGATKELVLSETIRFYGAWSTADNAITLDTWQLVTMTYDMSSVSNDPVLYINTSVPVLTEDSTPTDARKTIAGVPFMIGSLKTSTESYSSTFGGQIFDVRVYNRVLTAAEVTTLYNSGTPSMSAGYAPGSALYDKSLVFQGFAVRTGELANFTDATLDSSMKLFDAQYKAVGTVHGNPIGRAAP